MPASAERDIALRLKILRPQDGQALAAVAADAKRLEQGLRVAGTTGVRALSETTKAAMQLGTGMVKAGADGSRALDAAAAGAKRLQAEYGKGREAVTALSRELGRGARETAGIEKIASQLKALGIDANTATVGAARLMRTIGDGAKVTATDVARLAAAMRATGQAGGPGGIRGFLAQPIAGVSVGRGMMLQAGRSAVESGARAARESFRTDADQQILTDVTRNNPWSHAMSQAAQGLPVVGPVLGGLSDWSTLGDNPLGWQGGTNWALGRGSREGAAASQRRLQEQIRRDATRRQDRTMRTQGAIDQENLRIQQRRETRQTRTEAAAGVIAGREQSQVFGRGVRIEGIQNRFQQSMEAAQRGESGGVPQGMEAIAALRREGQNRPRIGQAEEFALGQEQVQAMQELTAAREAYNRAGENGRDLTMDQNAALQRQQQAESALADIARRRVELGRQQAAGTREQMEQERQLALQMQQSFQRLAQHERDRITGSRRSFGLMNETERESVMASASMLRQGRGRELGSDDLQRLQGMGLHDPEVNAEVERRANAGGFRQFMATSGAQARLGAAEAGARGAGVLANELKGKIENNFTISADDTAKKIADQILPAVKQWMATVQLDLDRRINQGITEAIRQRNLQNPQGAGG